MPNKTFKLTAPKPFIPNEWEEQVQVFDYAEYAARQDPRWLLLFATLNGLKLTIGQAVKAKRAGMRRGVPDIWLPVLKRWPDGNIRWVGQVIDIKRVKYGVESDAQKWRMDRLREQCWKADFCKGAKETIATLEEYLR